MNQLKDELRRSQADLGVMAGHEQKIGLLSQEIERVTMQLRAKNDEIHNLHQKITITESNSSQVQILSSEKSRL